jgi:hypothetical protein
MVGGRMTVKELKELLDKYPENLPVKFRGDKGRHYDTDYFVMSNDYKTVIIAEEWI